MLPGAAPGERELGLDVRLDRTLPAFTNGSLDGKPGTKVAWWNRALAGDRDFQSGEVAADAEGLVTVPQVRVRRGGSRLILEVKR